MELPEGKQKGDGGDYLPDVLEAALKESGIDLNRVIEWELSKGRVSLNGTIINYNAKVLLVPDSPPEEIKLDIVTEVNEPEEL